MATARHITKIIHTETGHRLTSYPHRCAHFHGHSYKWEVSVSSDKLDETGFIMDYKDLKVALNKIIDPLDHAFIMHDEDPMVLKHGRDEVVELLRATNGDIPRLFFVAFNPTSENIVAWVANGLREVLPKGIELTGIRLWETANSYCDYIHVEGL